MALLILLTPSGGITVRLNIASAEDGGGSAGSSGHDGHGSGGTSSSTNRGDGSSSGISGEDAGKNEKAGQTDERRGKYPAAGKVGQRNTVVWSSSVGQNVEVRYADGWTESVQNNTYTLLDPTQRIVARRAARQKDVIRLRTMAD